MPKFFSLYIFIIKKTVTLDTMVLAIRPHLDIIRPTIWTEQNIMLIMVMYYILLDFRKDIIGVGCQIFLEFIKGSR